MIEYTLEEDLLEEFQGGTLSIHPEQKLITPDPSPKPPDNNDNAATKTNNNQWGTSFISPLTSLPNKISETLWSKKPQQQVITSTGNTTNTTLQPTVCITEDPNNYFTFREGVIARALTECKDQFLDDESDGPLLEAFLLTQISHWNSDKERLLLLTPKTLVVAKYDFIALKRLGYKKLPLELVDEVVIGELVYPNGSLIPRLNGLAEDLSNVLETCLFSKWSKGGDKQLSHFYQPSNRKMRGVRLSWSKNKPPNFGSQWNPFNEDVPFCTFTFHPLYFHKEFEDEKLKNLYNLELFVTKLCTLIADLPRNRTPPEACSIYERDIVLHNYVGIGSVIHNRNSLGFFKVRGKFSF